VLYYLLNGYRTKLNTTRVLTPFKDNPPTRLKSRCPVWNTTLAGMNRYGSHGKADGTPRASGTSLRSKTQNKRPPPSVLTFRVHNGCNLKQNKDRTIQAWLGANYPACSVRLTTGRNLKKTSNDPDNLARKFNNPPLTFITVLPFYLLLISLLPIFRQISRRGYLVSVIVYCQFSFSNLSRYTCHMQYNKKPDNAELTRHT